MLTLHPPRNRAFPTIVRRILTGSILSLLAIDSIAQTTVTYTAGQIDTTNRSVNAPNNPTTLSIAAGSAIQSGVLSGTGSVIKSGAGFLSLVGANTFTGLVQVTGGTLGIADETALGAPANSLALSGGTLHTTSTHIGRTLTIGTAGTVNVPAFTTNQNAPLTGSGTLTKTGAGTWALTGGVGNTFSGDIVLGVNGGRFQVGSSLFGSPPAGSTLPGLTSANTITVNTAATFQFQDNGTGSATGAQADRLGTAGNRPNVSLTGGALTLLGNAAATGTISQTLGTLSLPSGASTVMVTRLSGTPQIVFSSLNRSAGAFANFTGTALGAGTGDGRVIFSSVPTLVGGGGAAGSPTISVLPGARSGNELATYGANGVRPLASSEYLSPAGNDLNGAGVTQNVKLSDSATAAFPALSGPKTVNSLVVSAATSATWAMSNTLTLTSGLLLHGSTSSLAVTSGTLTAGTGAAGAIDLNLTSLTGSVTFSGRIANNGSTTVALVKNGGSSFTLNGTADSTYTGGTVVNEGTVSTWITSGRRYLGTGPVLVNSSAQLILNSSGATSFSGSIASPTYTIRTGGAAYLGGLAVASNEFFKLESGAVLHLGGSGSASGLDLATNLNAAPGVIFAESAAGNNAAIKMGGVPIQSAVTTPTYFFGTAATNLQENVTVGAGTPWLGFSSGRATASYGGASASNNTITANSDFTLQGFVAPGVSSNALILGGGSSATNIIKIATPNGNVIADIVGPVTLNNDNSQYGSGGNTVTFRVTAGATLTTAGANAQGVAAGAAVAPAGIVVENGGTLSPSGAASLNGTVTLRPGSLLNLTTAPTGTGTITHSNGSILVLNSTTLVTGATQALGTAPGTIVRLGATGMAAGTVASGVTQFDSRLHDAAVYEANVPAFSFGAAPAATDSLLTLSASGGVGGVFTAAGGTVVNGAVGRITIGSGGGTFAATTGTFFSVGEDFSLGSNTLTIGSAQSYGGNPKLGTVALSATAGANTGSAGSLISIISGASLTLGAVDQIPDVTRLAIAARGSFNLAGRSERVESLTGAGSVLNTSTSATLILAPATTDADYSGTFAATTPANLLVTKTGAGTQTFSGTASNTATGVTTVSGGTLVLAKTAATAVAGNLTIGDGATTAGRDIVSLAGTGGNQIADASIVTLNGTGSNAGVLRLNARDETVGGLASVAGGGVVENGTAGTATLTLAVGGSAQSFSGILQNGAAGTLGVTKTGSATQTLTGANTFTGPTAISQGTLALGSAGSISASSAITIAAGAIFDVSAVISGASFDGTRFALANGQTLSGAGTVVGALGVGGGGTIAPGDGLGTLSVSGLSLTNASARFALELDLGGGGAADLLNVTGGLALGGGTLDLSLTNLGSLSGSRTFLFAANDATDPIAGIFQTITGVPDGYTAVIDYTFSGADSLGRIGTGNDLALTLSEVPVPEPGTALWGLAVASVACSRRLRRGRAQRFS